MKLDAREKRLLIAGVLLVVVDQVSKVLVKSHMSVGQSFNVLGDWFRICFIENNGMAFGMTFGGVVGKYILTLFRIILFGVLVWWIRKLGRMEGTPTGALVGLALIATGALGNIIDCMFYGMIWDYAPFMQGKVVDMLYFPIIDTYVFGKHITFFDPVFNVADSCVTVGAFYLLFFHWRFFSVVFGDDEKTDKVKE